MEYAKELAEDDDDLIWEFFLHYVDATTSRQNVNPPKDNRTKSSDLRMCVCQDDLLMLYNRKFGQYVVWSIDLWPIVVASKISAVKKKLNFHYAIF